MPYLVYAAGNSSVATINKNEKSSEWEYLESIVQTGSFCNHTHDNSPGLNISQMPPSGKYCANTYKIPIGAILIAPKVSRSAIG